MAESAAMSWTQPPHTSHNVRFSCTHNALQQVAVNHSGESLFQRVKSAFVGNGFS